MVKILFVSISLMPALGLAKSQTSKKIETKKDFYLTGNLASYRPFDGSHKIFFKAVKKFKYDENKAKYGPEYKETPAKKVAHFNKVYYFQYHIASSKDDFLPQEFKDKLQWENAIDPAKLPNPIPDELKEISISTSTPLAILGFSRGGIGDMKRDFLERIQKTGTFSTPTSALLLKAKTSNSQNVYILAYMDNFSLDTTVQRGSFVAWQGDLSILRHEFSTSKR